MAPQDPAMIRGGRSELIQHMIAAGHWKILTHSGGPHLSEFAYGLSTHPSYGSDILSPRISDIRRLYSCCMREISSSIFSEEAGINGASPRYAIS